MFCTKCGAKVDDDAKFCTGCGRALTMDEGATEQNGMQTHGQNSLNNDDGSRGNSPSGANSQSGNGMPDTGNDIEKPKKTGKILGILVLLAILGVATVFAVKLFGGKGDEKSSAVFYMKDGDVMMLSPGKKKPCEIEEAEVYVLSNGKYVLYGIDYNKKNGTFTLVCAPVSNPNKYKEIDDDVRDFNVNHDGNAIAYVNKDEEIYLLTSLSDLDSKMKVTENENGCAISHDWETVAYEDDRTLYVKNIKSGKKTKIADDVERVRYDNDSAFKTIYYLTEDGELYSYKNGKSTKIAEGDNIREIDVEGDVIFYTEKWGEDYYSESYDLYVVKNGESERIIKNADYVSLWSNGAKVDGEWVYFSNEGKILDFDDFDAEDTCVSKDGRYFYAVDEDGVLYSYVIDGKKCRDRKKVMTDVRFIYTSSEDDYINAGTEDGGFAMISGTRAYEIDDYNYTIYDGKLYYLNGGRLYMAMPGEKAEKLDTEKDVRYFALCGEQVYYVADWSDKKEEGDLYLVGKDKPVDEDVSWLGAYVESVFDEEDDDYDYDYEDYSD